MVPGAAGISRVGEGPVDSGHRRGAGRGRRRLRGRRGRRGPSRSVATVRGRPGRRPPFLVCAAARRIAEPGLVVPDITGGVDEDTVWALMAALEKGCATAGTGRDPSEPDMRARMSAAALRPGLDGPQARARWRESLLRPGLDGPQARARWRESLLRSGSGGEPLEPFRQELLFGSLEPAGALATRPGRWRVSDRRRA
ncbi:DUF6207 family protein [Streptomyces lavendulae]|uniref:DUF6207 family protein n=1 Tax=Streptomyces lavendulae TaxID=1914 RepID=UPI00382547D5